jgi:enoyl reductase-like protein/3-oxoacyl-ACP reductase-like protein/acyl dehydratase
MDQNSTVGAFVECLGKKTDQSVWIAEQVMQWTQADDPSHPATACAPQSLADRVQAGELGVAITFAGQGVGWIDELAELARTVPAVAELVEVAAHELAVLSTDRAFAWSGLLPARVDLLRWLMHTAERPDARTLAGTVLSQPGIFLTQAARWAWLLDHGFDAAIRQGAVRAATGHSQGVMAALLVAETAGARIDPERLRTYVRAMAWQGLCMARSAGDSGARQGEATPMAAISGPDTQRLERAVAQVAAQSPDGERPVVALHNTRTRHVVSGPARALLALKTALEAAQKAETDARKAGRFGGRPLQFTWEWLDVGDAFHGPLMARGLDAMLGLLSQIGFTIPHKDLHFPVLSPQTAQPYAPGDVAPQVMRDQFVGTVRWTSTCRALADLAPVVVDLGPGDGVAKLTASVLRGTGKRVVALGVTEGRRQWLDTAGPGPAPADWSQCKPRLVLRGGELRLENRFTDVTGMPPVILPGMTPTTADAPIVAAAANAGFWSELAGGGQPTVKTLDLRLEELQGLLQPGRGFVFNTLHLDPWLWDLHVGKGLLVKARKAGVPVDGITVSAGIPERDVAVRLVRQWRQAGIAHIAFKPGTGPQIDQVCAIAAALPEVALHAQIEGGKAGGHHSWEDLDQLLLDGYAKLRARPNLVVAVGGGIADEARAVELLTGTWARKHGQPDMPVDAVFLGTLAMACQEATASPQVKQALVAAAGTPGWVFAGRAQGGVTSGKSQLGADIHYLDNTAAQVGRLLDSVAGDADAVRARKAEIVAALARTAKPYFGDFEALTWRAVLLRFAALTAQGQGGRYDDGRWLDATFRTRMVELFRRAEARCAGRDGTVQPSLVQAPADLDDPEAAVAALAARHPIAATLTPEPDDLAHFLAVCAQAGKPVPFVPVIDADVRRWYKADALWQAQDSRHAADAVLIIPGPEAVAGIRRADEPVAALLGRFEQAVIAHLQANGGPTVAPLFDVTALQWPAGVDVRCDGRTLVLTAASSADPVAWLDAVARQFTGPVAAACRSNTAMAGKRRIASPVRQVCVAEPGATLRIDHTPAGEATALHWHGVGGERATLQVAAHVGGGATPLRCEIHLAVAGAPVLAFAAVHEKLPRGQDVVRWQPQSEPVQALYDALFAAGQAVGLFAPAMQRVVLEPERAAAYQALVGGSVGGTALDQAFSLAFPCIFQVLACDELRGGWLQLLHARHAVEVVAPLSAGDEVDVAAQVERVADGPGGRSVTVVSTLSVGGAERVRLRTVLLLRGDHEPMVDADGTWRLLAREPLRRLLDLGDAAAVTLLAEQPWLQLRPGAALHAGDRLTLDAVLTEKRDDNGRHRFAASGQLSRDQVVLAAVELAPDSGSASHPVAVLADLLAEPQVTAGGPRKTLGSLEIHAPSDARPFAEVSGDLNPIHQSTTAARLAGLSGPIVHGMWTAARLHRFAESVGGAIVKADAEFLAPVLPGERLRFDVARTGMRGGLRVVEATASVLRDGGAEPVARSQMLLKPPRTAYVFPGQGIQKQGMGMDGYARSRAARAVWDRADAFTRSVLGFSVLHVVRQNPKALDVAGERLHHPDGVLHLTQFTQVAMAVLAVAQVAELRENEALCDDAIGCGHSVGEYDALAGWMEVLPLESVVDIVWLRGCTMHTVVPRDADGRSPYRMGVVRPNLAGLDHAGAEALVAAVRAKTGAFVQIVNHNVRDRQYSVTGEVLALAALELELAARVPKGGKPAWLPVPGIDVPFHSEVLKPAVPAFRAVLDARLPTTIAPEKLVGRYVPNLVARAFALDEAFVRSVLEATDSPQLSEALGNLTEWQQRPGELARLLLVELLAWQFASPVRWIETQELLVRPVARGGLGVERIVEVGVGHQPTLANMARTTLEGLGPRAPRVQILNAEADLDAVLERDADPQAVPAVAPVAAPEPLPNVTAAVAVAVPAMVTGAGPAPERPIAVPDALKALLALQARIRPEQVREGETVDELFEGVSSRRNQALLDLGTEFGVGAIDGAHERPLPLLAGEIAKRNPGYQAPGRYLRAAGDEAVKRLFGRAGLQRKDVVGRLKAVFGLSDATSEGVVLDLALHTRAGESARGGKLASLDDGGVANKAAAEALIDAAAQAWAQRQGLALGRTDGGATAAGGVVDAAAVTELAERLLGCDGVLVQAARDLAAHAGHRLQVATEPAAEPVESSALLYAELGAAFVQAVTPAFDPRRHAFFAAPITVAQRDVAKLYFDGRAGRLQPAEINAEAQRLGAFHAEPRVRDAARWFAPRCAGHDELAKALLAIAQPQHAAALPVIPCRPATTVNGDGSLDVRDVPDHQPHALARWIDALFSGSNALEADSWNDLWRETLDSTAQRAADLRHCTALVTGASPASIAWEVVRHLLRSGCKVVVTTSTYAPQRLHAYRQLFQRSAGPGAELHVVAFNQASVQDVDALVAWLFGPAELAPDLLLPFAAVKDMGTLDGLGAQADVALRAMLLGVERLIAGIGKRWAGAPTPGRRCHVVVPLSPNHGQFGGDGAYAETKAGLETLAKRWVSEQHTWGRGASLCLARIGWVRGTGLMDQNDAVAARLETATGVRTFSSAEMGWLLASACGRQARQQAETAPLSLDLTGGFAAIADVKGTVESLRKALLDEAAAARRLTQLRSSYQQRVMPPAAESVAVHPLPPVAHPVPARPLAARTMPAPRVPLERMVVVVGVGELGPCGSARTRRELELGGPLSFSTVLELAWMTGLVRRDPQQGWVDAATGAALSADELVARCEPAVRQRVGVRKVDPKTAGFDPGRMTAHAVTFLDRDVTFQVATQTEARNFLDADPQWTRIAPQGDGWRVTRCKGAEVRVPKVHGLDRKVAGLLPDGLDFARFGVPRDMIGNTDPTALMDLIATADAFASAGLEPEELLREVHPARIANTQGSGIGGMKSLRRLYLDPPLDRERQTDALQETLINVMGAYAVQAYVGSYGAMAHPVGACATAAVSVEQAVDKLLGGRAEFVVAGGFDDYGPEGAVGFADMNATASSDDMAAAGLEPWQMSRPNDARRKGFVEAQGGGTFLLARGDVALRMGLPVFGVVAYAGSFADGVHRSIPAPGQGVLAAASGGAESPLGRALADFALTADDIALVSKHDTSTGANDPNESRLHHRIQQALHRTPGNPLFVVSQKSLTGHSKGGAAAWQMAGVLQCLVTGQLPGNRNLDSVDPTLAGHTHLCWTDAPLQAPEPLRAGLVTSLGFGHVGAIVLLVHPDAFVQALDPQQQEQWSARANERQEAGRRRLARVLQGEVPWFERRTHRRFAAPDGSEAQHDEEAALLLDPAARLQASGRYGKDQP